MDPLSNGAYQNRLMSCIDGDLSNTFVIAYYIVGGNSAGLLNFGKQPCPYDLVSPWEFGTRHQNGKRQTDIHLKLVCVDQTEQQSGFIQNAPAPLKAGINLVSSILARNSKLIKRC